jgi:hypothetical protein
MSLGRVMEWTALFVRRSVEPLREKARYVTFVRLRREEACT